jgi:hypothetical protein
VTSGDSASGMAMSAGAMRDATSQTEDDLAPNVSEPQQEATSTADPDTTERPRKARGKSGCRR